MTNPGKSNPRRGILSKLAYRNIPAAALIVAAVFIVYLPSIGGEFIWDDDAYVSKNETLRTAEGLRRIWLEPQSIPQYYPLVHTTFWAQYQIHGLNPAGYRLLNVALHAANALLLLALLRYLKIPGAWLAAAIFALHPINVESTAWITQRKNTLSLFFYLSSLIVFCRCYRLGPETSSSEGDVSPPVPLYLAGTALFLGALFSKTVTCTLPAALLLLIWWKRGALSTRALVSMAPLFIMGAVLGLTTVWLEKHHVGARGEYWNLLFVERCLIAGRILWFYAGKLAWPFRNTFIYPRWEVNPRTWWQYLYPLSFIAVTAALWARRRRIGRGPLAAVLFYAGTLFPALGFFDVYPMRFSFVADHFQYHAGIGLIILAAAGGTIVIERAGKKISAGKQQWSRGTIALLAALPMCALGTLTWSQARVYRNQAVLWRDTLDKNPNAWMAMGNYAVLISNKGRHAEASELFKRFLAIKEKSEIHNIAYFIIGMAHLEEGQIDQARANYLKALEFDPGFRPAHYQLGVAAFAAGDLKAGIAALELAVSLDPSDVEMINRVGTFYARQGMLSEARTKFERALSLQPGNRQALRHLENILKSATEPAEDR